MAQRIGLVSLVVKEYDEAIDFYTQQLGFKLIEATQQEGKRWVVVAPSSGGTSLLLARATTQEQLHAIGNQTGGRVFLFLYTDDFARDYQTMVSKGVQFLEEPREETYGTLAVFQDLYGNKWDLLQPK